MAKRSKLEVLKDILEIIKENHNGIRKTPLIRKSNLSTARFGEYNSDLIKKQFIIERKIKNEKRIFLTQKGERFLVKYQSIINFLEEFDL
jgi:predicted transcriptional regulator